MVNVFFIIDDDFGVKFEEIVYFDVCFEDDEVGGEVIFNGVWFVYFYFNFGYFLVNSIECGIYLFKYNFF